MKSLGGLPWTAILLVVACGTTPARADEASKQAKVEELFSVMHMDQMVPQMTQQMMAQMQQMMASQFQKLNLPPEAGPKLEEVQKKMAALVGEKCNWQKLRPMYVKVYADTFTEEELDGITGFYKTPAGQAFLKKTPLLTQNVMRATQGMMGDLMAEIPRILDEVNRQYNQKPQ